jgi:GNAT superfamily N-acetyltransferase
MQIRTANIQDLPKLLEYEQFVIQYERQFDPQLKSDGAKYYDLELLITSHDAELLIGELDTEIIATGYAKLKGSKQAHQHEFHAYFGFMYVHPDHRGKGVNQLIIQKLIDWSRLKNASCAYLDVYPQNQGAIKAYEKMQFEKSLLEMRLEL